MTVAALTLLAAAAALGLVLDRRNTCRFRRIELDVDRVYARSVHDAGMSPEAIAVELGRPAHQIRDWLETDAVDRQVA